MKNILVISDCPRRGGGTGLTGLLLSGLSKLSDSICKVDLFDTSFFSNHKVADYNARSYYSMSDSFVDKLCLSIPYLSAFYKKKVVCKRLASIFRKVKYDIVIVHQIPPYVDEIVRIAHQNKVKSFLLPWGSEVLRVANSVKSHLQRAYNETDYVGGDPESNVILNALYVYHVPEYKIINVSSGLPGVRKLMGLKGKLLRTEMLNSLGISSDSFVIVCGYNAYTGQHHPEIIVQISSVKQYLPNNTLLVFPMTYGGDNRLGYIEALKQQCTQNGIAAKFYSDFLSAEQMAYLHLITNIYVNVQPTDSGNAFLIEALYSENTVICGKWLDYPQLQKYGIPYYQCESLEQLGETIKGIIKGTEPKVTVPQKLIDDWTAKNGITFKDRWTDFLNKI